MNEHIHSNDVHIKPVIMQNKVQKAKLIGWAWILVIKKILRLNIFDRIGPGTAVKFLIFITFEQFENIFKRSLKHCGVNMF